MTAPLPNLASALAALDGLIERELARLRARYQLSLDEFRGLYLTETMVNALLADTPASMPPPSHDWQADFGALADRFGLCPLGCAALALALAPEVDAKYPMLIAYLNDDVSRRWPTLDLALRLFAGGADQGIRARLRTLFSPSGELVGEGLLVPADAADSTRPLLLQGWRAAAPLVRYCVENAPSTGAQWLRGDPSATTAVLPSPESPWPALLLTGRTGVGRRDIALAWARSLHKPVLLCRLASASGDTRTAVLGEATLSAKLHDAVLVLDADGVEQLPAIPGLCDVPLVVLTDASRSWPERLAPRLVWQIPVPTQDQIARGSLWKKALKDSGLRAPAAAITTVAERYRLTPPAVTRAVRRLALGPSSGKLGLHDLSTVARIEAAADLGPLAHRVQLVADWNDLVLPAGALRQLKDFAGAIANRTQVFESWGFGGGRTSGTGLTALFSGGSGTGKTMSAGVIARELGLDLWRIDLSGLISKYIGETEKNLERVFSAAGVGDAILFFDEADAIFGKRSEVKDSHDRYANIEIAYLLQRLEEHDGVVILASNLSRNLDAAFLRRLHAVIEFPMPDVAARECIWRKVIPGRAPLGHDTDLERLARVHELSGGDIRAAALEAGFLAAQRGTPIDAAALETAVKRQLLKRGLLPAATAQRRNGHATPAANGATL